MYLLRIHCICKMESNLWSCVVDVKMSILFPNLCKSFNPSPFLRLHRRVFFRSFAVLRQYNDHTRIDHKQTLCLKLLTSRVRFSQTPSQSSASSSISILKRHEQCLPKTRCATDAPLALHAGRRSNDALIAQKPALPLSPHLNQRPLLPRLGGVLEPAARLVKPKPAYPQLGTPAKPSSEEGDEGPHHSRLQ